MYSEDLGRNDTSFIRKKICELRKIRRILGVVKEEPMERIEAIEYYKTNIPDSSNYYCPYTS